MDWYVDDRRPPGATEGDSEPGAPPRPRSGGVVEAVTEWGGECLNTPLEWARAPRDLAVDDGSLPLAAWEAGTVGQALGLLTPLHGIVASDQITAVPAAALALSADDSRALFDAVQPLFHSEGVALDWRHPLAWQVAHHSLDGLPTASLARVEGDALHRWQARTPLAASRLIRRLQNEAQMVLHAHPVNASRAERGLLPVNTLWLSGTGLAATPHPTWQQQVVKPLAAEASVSEADLLWNQWLEQATPDCRLHWANETRVIVWRKAPPAPERFWQAWLRWWKGDREQTPAKGSGHPKDAA